MNWKMFKELSLSKKIQWVFQYYGVTIGVAIVAIFVGTVFFTSVFGTDAYAIRVLILDDRLSSEVCQEFGRELGDLLSGECDITSYMPSNEDQMQAFVVRLMTDELDLIIAPAEEMEQLAQNGYLRSSAALGEDSLYRKRTGSGSEPFFIGETARSRNADHIAAAMDYFMKNLA